MVAVEDQTRVHYPIRTRSCWRSSKAPKWQRLEMKLIICGIVAFILGAGCRSFDIPVPSHPVLPGTLFVCRNDARLYAASSGWAISASALGRS
jgi:XapX domain-containing protein